MFKKPPQKTYLKKPDSLLHWLYTFGISHQLSMHQNCSVLSWQSRVVNDWHHLSELVLFALAMQETLKEINKKHSSNNFQLRVGNGSMDRPQSICHIQCDVNEAVNRNRSKDFVRLLCTYRCQSQYISTKDGSHDRVRRLCTYVSYSLVLFLITFSKIFSKYQLQFQSSPIALNGFERLAVLDLDRPCSLNTFIVK